MADRSDQHCPPGVPFKEWVEDKFSHSSELSEERDKRYNERFQAHEKAVKAAFESSEKAIGKAEMSQSAYNAGHNDLTRKMEKQAENFATKQEMQEAFKARGDRSLAILSLVLVGLQIVSGFVLYFLLKGG